MTTENPNPELVAEAGAVEVPPIEGETSINVLHCLTGETAFGPEPVPNSLTLGELKLCFDTHKAKDLLCGGRILDDTETVGSLPPNEDLYVAHIMPEVDYAAPSRLLALRGGSAGEFSVVARVCVPELALFQAAKAANRVGVILGNHLHIHGGRNYGCNGCCNLEIHARGQIRLWWQCGSVDIYGTTDLRDGADHIVGFTWDGSQQLKVYVDGRLEAEALSKSIAPSGLELSQEWPGIVPHFVGCDWREGGMHFRGDITTLKCFSALVPVDASTLEMPGEAVIAEYASPSRLCKLQGGASGQLSLVARIKIPEIEVFRRAKQENRIGTILGNNSSKPASCCTNFEVDALGRVRFYSGNFFDRTLDLLGTTDLRDGKEHVVGFSFDGASAEVSVDGQVEATASLSLYRGKPSQKLSWEDPNIPSMPHFICCDWREGGLGFRGDVFNLKCIPRAMSAKVLCNLV